MDLKQAINLFLGRYKPTTREAYHFILIPMQDYLGPARPVLDLRPEHVIEYYNHLVASAYAPATKNKAIKGIKTFFNWLVSIESIEKSPAKTLKRLKREKYVSRDKAMSEDEFTRLLTYLQFKPRDYALILFLADTGSRALSAAYLTLDTLSLQTKTARVIKKGGDYYPVAFETACAQAIAYWLHQRPPAAGVYVFSRSAVAVKPANISQIIRRACLKVGIRSLGSHSLRHRKGHQFSDAGTSPSIAAVGMGHASPQTTLENYYPHDWETAERELRKLAYRPPASRAGNVIPLEQKEGSTGSRL